MTKPDKENVDERYQEGDQHSHHLHGAYLYLGVSSNFIFAVKAVLCLY